MTSPSADLIAACVAVLEAPGPTAKKAAAKEALDIQERDGPPSSTFISPPETPAKPDQPLLVPPASVPRRRLGAAEGRIALLHAVAHIEFNAIDLAFDMAARFHRDIASAGLDAREFVHDWVRIGAEEAYHFSLIEDRLGDYHANYGDLPAHNGLWEAAEKTKNNLAARLVVAPMILEARGLDVTPGMIERLEVAGDQTSADRLKIIYRDEIGHVACGQRWFSALCARRQEDPNTVFIDLRREYFAGALKPPFNYAARTAAGLPREYYDAPLEKAPK